MIDFDKAIKNVENKLNRELTETEKNMISLFGDFMNVLWSNNENSGKDGADT